VGWFSANLENEDVSGLFASGVSDAETVSNALMQLSFLIQGATGAETPLTTREVGGGQVYVIELGDEAGSTIEFGVVGDTLVIGRATRSIASARTQVTRLPRTPSSRPSWIRSPRSTTG
jgi:hypothetical protein